MNSGYRIGKCVPAMGSFLFCAMAAAVFAASPFSKKQARVLVDSYARPGYEESRLVDGEIQPETYHLFQGRHFGGNIRDPSLREVPFMEVAETLAKEMEARKYYSEPETEKGDFLISVHWGVTGIEEDFDELFLNEPGDPGVDNGDSTFDSTDGDTQDGFSDSAPEEYRSLDDYGPRRNDKNNASLVGFDRALNQRGLSVQDEYELKSMLRDERYFIILMAYDWQKLRTEREYELVWSTRFSLDAIGTNFKDAHFALSRGAANYFGTNLDGELGKTKTHLGTGDVELGDLEVLGTVEETPAEK